MSPSIIDQNHITFYSYEDVNKYCLPIKKYGFCNFDYVRVYKKNKMRLHLGNDLNWLQFFYTKCYTNENLFFEVTNKKLYEFDYSYVNLWNNHPNSDTLNKIITRFDIGHGVTLILNNPEFYEFFYLATYSENSNIYQCYATNINLLKQFCFNFKFHASKIIKAAEAQKIVCPISNLNYINNNYDNVSNVTIVTEKNLTLSSDNVNQNTFSCEMNEISKYYIGDISISKKERDIAYWIAQGKSSEEIAIIMNVSKRTVEKHLTNIKDKFDCRKSTQLIYILSNLSII